MADNKLLSLTEIFNQKFFRIPDYQRGYSWKEKQLNDFWDDLINLKEEKIHYIGQLTVKQIKKSEIHSLEKWNEDLWLFDKGFSAFYLIDGQQRLTTSIIFISELLNYFESSQGINFDTRETWQGKFLFKQFGDHYKSYIFGYEKDNPSDEYFRTRILGQHSSTSDKVPDQTLYTANLEAAKQFFGDKFGNLGKNELEVFFKKLVNKFKFSFYEIDDDLDEFVTFETMNNRGKPLSTLELLKNRLIYLTTLLDDEKSLIDRLRKDINETWKTVYEYLGKNKKKPLNDDVFLYNHWIMYYKYDRSLANAYTKFLLHDKFTPKNVLLGKLKFQEIKHYIDSIGESAKSWFKIYNIEYSSYGSIIKEWVQKLNRLGLGAFPPLLMTAFNKERSEEKLLSMIQAMERFQFLIFKISQRQANTKNSHLYRLSNMYHRGDVYWGDGITDITKVTNDIKWHIDGWSNDEEYIGLFDLIRFTSHVKELFQKNEGYYSWNGLRYFLFEYELYLQDKANGNIKISWEDFNIRKKEDTIEHIYPQTDTEMCWQKAFEEIEKKQRKLFLHSLGNLVLLARSKNSSLQNKCFDHKKHHKNTSNEDFGFFNGSYSEIQVALYANWTPVEVKERGIAMLKFLEDRWGFKISDWSATPEDLLNL